MRGQMIVTGPSNAREDEETRTDELANLQALTASMVEFNDAIEAEAEETREPEETLNALLDQAADRLEVLTDMDPGDDPLIARLRAEAEDQRRAWMTFKKALDEGKGGKRGNWESLSRSGSAPFCLACYAWGPRLSEDCEHDPISAAHILVRYVEDDTPGADAPRHVRRVVEQMLAALPNEREENTHPDHERDDAVREALEEVLVLFDDDEVTEELPAGGPDQDTFGVDPQLRCRKCSARGVALLDPCVAVPDTGVHEVALWIDGKLDESVQVSVPREDPGDRPPPRCPECHADDFAPGIRWVVVPIGEESNDEDMLERTKATEESAHNPGAWPAVEASFGFRHCPECLLSWDANQAPANHCGRPTLEGRDASSRCTALPVGQSRTRL